MASKPKRTLSRTTSETSLSPSVRAQKHTGRFQGRGPAAAINSNASVVRKPKSLAGAAQHDAFLRDGAWKTVEIDDDNPTSPPEPSPSGMKTAFTGLSAYETTDDEVSDIELVRIAKQSFRKRDVTKPSFDDHSLHKNAGAGSRSGQRRHSIGDNDVTSQLDAAVTLLEERERELKLAAEIGQILLARNERLQSQNAGSLEVQERLVSANSTITELQKQQEESDNRVKKAESENRTLNNRCSMLRRQVDEFEEMNVKLMEDKATIEQELERQKTDAVDWKSKNNQLKGQVDTLTAEVSQLSKSKSDLHAQYKKLKLENDQTKARLSAAQSELGHLHEQLKLPNRRQDAPSEDLDLEVKLREAQVEIERLEEALEEKDRLSSMCDALSTANTNINSEQEEAKALLDESKREVVRLKEENERLEETLVQGEKLMELATFMLNPRGVDDSLLQPDEWVNSTTSFTSTVSDQSGTYDSSFSFTEGEPASPSLTRKMTEERQLRFADRMAAIIDSLREKGANGNASDLDNIIRETFVLRKSLNESSIEKLNPLHKDKNIQSLLMLSNKKLDDIIAKAEMLSKIETYKENAEATESALACELLDLLMENAGLRKRLNDYSEAILMKTWDKVEKFKEDYQKSRSTVPSGGQSGPGKKSPANGTNAAKEILSAKGMLRRLEAWRSRAMTMKKGSKDDKKGDAAAKIRRTHRSGSQSASSTPKSARVMRSSSSSHLK
eukprot:GFYU01005456.1.p1 GENE.GFYU01005456.1~~GFYU01005456.1.p1  ORF type:complete len:728 (-),score=182.70 GFYU01005456.1:97-2280(-)